MQMKIDKILSSATDELLGAGIKSAEIDARVLLKFVLDQDDVWILSHNDALLSNSQYQKFRRLIRRRKKGEPVSYLTGHKEFYGYDFLVNKNVLIPRPETEMLVENSLKFLESNLKYYASNIKPVRILDIGTGSGCIIISLAKKLLATNFRLPTILNATDNSKKALTVAKKNAKLHQVDDQIKFYYSDLFSNKRLPKKFELIIANLPYVPKVKAEGRSWKTEVRSQKLEVWSDTIKYEPREAIFANDNGTAIIKKFLNQAKDRIDSNGMIVLEVDPRNAKELIKYSKNIFTNGKVELIKDLAKLNRVIRILQN